jgi:N-acyl homoserine lactone hydrolase
MTEEQRITSYLARLGLAPADIDLVFLGHLHFDHAGGLCDLPGCEVHVHADELAAARSSVDEGVFADEISGADSWRIQTDEYPVASGIRAINTPGHTAGHMSLIVELPHGAPVILCGDAADLTENLDDEVAPGYCWNDNVELALHSIRKLKGLAREAGAELWPNHDFAFFNQLPQFPSFRD